MSNDAVVDFSFMLYPRDWKFVIKFDAWLHGQAKKESVKAKRAFFQPCSFTFMRPAKIIPGVDLKNQPIGEQDEQDVIFQLQPYFSKHNITISSVDFVQLSSTFIGQFEFEVYQARLMLV